MIDINSFRECNNLETLYQFWHALNGLAATYISGEVTTTLVLDMYILHMNNKKVQETIHTEPREPDQTMEYAIAFEEGVKPQSPLECKMLNHQSRL